MSLAENIEFLSRLPKPGDWPIYGRGLHGEPSSPLHEMRGFGSNPGNLRMFMFAPARLQQPRALVVVLHGCGQTAASYDLGAGWSTLAKHSGFALLLPQQQSANNANGCFNWFNTDDIARGHGEACSIRQMIARMVHDYNIDPRRIFVTGLSAGGAATINTAFSRPELFRYVVIMSAGAPANVDQLYPSFFGASGAAAKALRLVWVSAGSEDFALNGSKTLDEALTKNGIKHSFTTRAGYRHEWRLWRQDLWEFAPLLFKEPAKGTN